jgi:hypothetical protein
MSLTPQDYPGIFGKHFTTENSVPIIVIGDKSYTKYDLGRIGCPHTIAAKTLHRTLQQLGAKDLKDVAARFSPTSFVGVKGFRETAFYALTCLLDDANISVKKFYKEKVTIGTLAARARKPKKKKKWKRKVAA